MDRGLMAWFWTRRDPNPSWLRVIAWWELRRLPFNVIIGSYGIACLVVFYWSIMTSGHLAPGEDAVEPLAIIVAPFVVNILYTLGWFVELAARVLSMPVSSEFAPLLLKTGLVLGLVLISLPAIAWGGYRLLQLLGAMK